MNTAVSKLPEVASIMNITELLVREDIHWGTLGGHIRLAHWVARQAANTTRPWCFWAVDNDSIVIRRVLFKHLLAFIIESFRRKSFVFQFASEYFVKRRKWTISF